MDFVQFEEYESDDIQAPRKNMKNLCNTKPFRFIDDLYRKASEQSNSTNHSPQCHSDRSFSGSKRKRSPTQAYMRLDFNSNNSDCIQTFDGKIMGGTCPVGRSISRKKLSIQKKRSSAYPLNGDGFTKLHDGRVVFGIWENGRLTGNAKIMYPTADVYVGEVKDYDRHGAGQLTLHGGQKYIGHFLNGKCEGLGTKYDQNGNFCASGMWKNGILIKRID